MKICLNCGCCGRSTFDEEGYYYIESIPDSFNVCPRCNNNTIIECDENLIGVVYRLNRLGYKTRFSCAGHPENWYESMYIAFDNYHDNIREWCESTKVFKFEEDHIYYSKSLNLELTFSPDDERRNNEDFIFRRRACTIRAILSEEDYPDFIDIEGLTYPHTVNFLNLIQYLESSNDKNKRCERWKLEYR